MPQPLRRLQALARDGRHEALRGRLRNVGQLLSGNVANAVLALIAIALTARALGPSSYGILAMAFAFVRAIERLVTFQSWQPIIRYGAALQGADHRHDMASLLKFGLMLDAGGALIGWLIGISIASIGAPLMGWSDEVRLTVIICCMMLPFNLNGMPTAALRLYGNYRMAAWGPVTGTFLRLIGCAFALMTGAGLSTFAAIWAATQALGYVIFLGLGFHILRRNGITGVLSASVGGVPARFEGIWRFAWLTNLSMTLRSSASQLDILIVGALAGPAAAGLYSIATRAGRLAEQVSTQVQAVLFPDVARLWAAGRRLDMRRAIQQFEVILFLFGLGMTLLLWIFGETVIRLAAGSDFAGAAPLLVVQMMAVTVAMVGAGNRSGLLAMGQEGRVVTASLIGVGVFHALAFTLIPLVGPMGANIAHIGFGLVTSGLMVKWCRDGLRKTPA